MTNPEIHPHWHRFSRGGCIYCGYYCIDCPTAFTACKCTPKSGHIFFEECRLKWCRIHWYPGFDYHERYPMTIPLYTSRFGWVQQEVHCGPTGFKPKRS